MKMNFNIGELHPNSPHLFADLVELLLLTDYFGKMYLHKSDLAELLNKEVISHEEIDCEEELIENKQSSSEYNGRSEEQIDEVMAQLEYREKSLSSFYPFIKDGEEFRLSPQLDEKCRIYRFLLACSRLRSFESKRVSQKWAKCFTNLSKLAMMGLLPKYAKVRIFDANSEDRRTYYGTNLRDALKKLGNDLRVTGINNENIEKISTSGDGGVDLVGGIDFDDGAVTSFAILGQCGAREKDWPKKTLESHAMNIGNFFHMQYHFPSAMFTPILFRTISGEWVDAKCANGVFIADRSRILKLLEMQNKCNSLVDEPWFLDFESELQEIASHSR